MSRQGIVEVRTRLRKLLGEASSYDLEQAQAAIETLGNALSQTLDTIDQIDREAPRRIYDQMRRAHNAVEHHLIDRHIANLARRLRLSLPTAKRPPQPSDRGRGAAARPPPGTIEGPPDGESRWARRAGIAAPRRERQRCRSHHRSRKEAPANGSG